MYGGLLNVSFTVYFVVRRRLLLWKWGMLLRCGLRVLNMEVLWRGFIQLAGEDVEGLDMWLLAWVCLHVVIL